MIVVGLLSCLFAASLALGGPPRFIPPWSALFLLSLSVCIVRGRRGSWLETRPSESLFFICLTLYLSSFRWHGGDDIPNSLLPFSILRHGTFSFEPFRAWATDPALHDLIIPGRDGRLVSFYPVAPAVVALPVYLIPSLFVSAPSDQFLHSLAKISGALITSLSVVVLFWALEKRCSRRWAATVALAYGLGTFSFSVSSQALYSHGPAQLGVALALLGVLSSGSVWSAAAGFGLGLAVVSREDSAFFALAFAVYFLLKDRRRFLPFAVAGFVPLALNLLYWKWSSGEFKPPYAGIQSGLFGALDPAALWAMLVSPSRGLLTFCPFVVFGLWGGVKAVRSGKAPWAVWLLIACAATWIFYGFRQSWTGGVTFGNRYFAVIALAFAFFCGELEAELAASPRARAWWGALFGVSVVIHALGAWFTWPGVAMNLAEQAGTLWSPDIHPAVELFLKRGGLGGLPAPARWALAAVILSLSVPLGRWAAGRTRAGAS